MVHEAGAAGDNDGDNADTACVVADAADNVRASPLPTVVAVAVFPPAAAEVTSEHSDTAAAAAAAAAARWAESACEGCVHCPAFAALSK